MLAKLILKSGKDQSVRRYHPWVFSGAIKKIKGSVVEGDLVEIFDNKEEFLALGHYQASSIAVRIISFEQVEPDYSFWKSKIEQAYQSRISLGLAGSIDTDVYRLINAEGDGLPGLIVDFYNGTAVMQMHSIGMYHIRHELAKAIKEVLGDRIQAIYDKSSGTLPFKADIEPENGYLLGKSETKEVSEKGCKYKIDWKEGQKTGFFIDQRENRSLLEYYAKDREVLNMFCYTGGFSVSALRGNAKLVHSVDSSRKAIDLTTENVKMNFPETSIHKVFAVDAFSFFDDIKDKYDLMILDPPAFAKHHNVLHNALQGYKRLNLKAFENIRKGGIVFTFSCSQVVTRENFRKSVFAAAANTGRSISILHQLSQPADHPVSIYHPEGEYLKGLVLRVD